MFLKTTKHWISADLGRKSMKNKLWRYFYFSKDEFCVKTRREQHAEIGKLFKHCSMEIYSHAFGDGMIVYVGDGEKFHVGTRR